MGITATRYGNIFVTVLMIEGIKDAFSNPGFVPSDIFVPPFFVREGPFRWGGIVSGS